ncbi:MAG: RluA family pseudouridine synthase [Candidatus Krumholzibacteriia bacterium]
MPHRTANPTPAPNRGYTYAGRVDARSAGRTLIDYLTQRYPHGSAVEWRERIAAGRVRVGGHTVSADTTLRRGDTVTWARPPWVEPAAPLRYTVLLEDAAFVAVAKPAGLPTLPGGGYLEHTLLALVRAHYPEAAPAHRLDRGASGIVLFTRTPEAARAIALAWREQRVEKVYHALVEGRPVQDAFTIETPIGRSAHPARGAVFAADPAGKPARSELRVLERRERTSLVEIRLATGRPHQARIHLAACGHPLLGDPLYAAGGGLREAPGRPGDAGYHLHAIRLAFPHPESGERVDIHCPPPD